MRSTWILVVAILFGQPCFTLAALEGRPVSTLGSPKPSKTPQRKKTVKKESFLTWLEVATGLSATASGLRGGEDDERGEVWMMPIKGEASRKLTPEGGFSWPVFSADDQQVIALRDGQLWAIPIRGGELVRLAHPRVEVVSLVGSGRDGLVVLTADQIGMLDIRSGDFSPFEPTSEEERDEIAMLRAPSRSYGQGQLTVAERNGVLEVTQKGKVRKMAYKGTASWQPSVSHDGSEIAFIRTVVSPP